MKKIIMFSLVLGVLSLGLPQSALAGSAVNIAKDGLASATEVKVVQIAGSTFFTRLYWGLAYIRVTVKTTPTTKFYRGTGELTTLSEIAEGDFLEISGELEPNTSALTIVASTVKNASVQKKQTVASGKVTSVDLAQRNFVLNSPKLGLITVSVKPTTTYTKGNRSLDLEHILVGDTITKAAGDYDLTSKTLSAGSVVTYVDMSYYKPQNFEGKVVEVSGTNLPATMKILIGKITFTVNLNEKTAVTNKAKAGIALTRFIPGDSVRMYGVIREVDEPILDADIVRNMSI